MTAWQFPKARILVFARAPEPGKVKTRLQPLLGESGCLALYRQLLRQTLHTVQDANLAPMRLWVDQDPQHEDFLSFCTAGDIHEQQGADLGERMGHAIDASLCEAEVEAVLLIGSDCPALDKPHLLAALQALQSGETAVITPAEDGGYVLLGLSRSLPVLFSGIEWGKEDVFAATLQRFDAAGIKPCKLPVLWDVDRPEDLQRLLELDSENYAFLARRIPAARG